jgi:tetratricopeptide (TPR) repeat protein
VSEAGNALSSIKVLAEEGDALRAAGRYDKAISLYDRIVREFGQLDEDTYGRAVRVALAKKGSALVQLDRFREADAVFDALCARTVRAPEPAVALEQARRLIAAVLSRRLRALSATGSYEQAILAADALLERFRDESPLVPDALESKADALARLGKAQEADAVYRDLVEGYRDASTDPRVGSQVASALAARAELLTDQDLYVDALDLIDELVTRFGQVSEFEMRLQTGHALLKKAILLGLLERWESAIAVEDEIIKRYADEAELELKEDAARALSLKALAFRKLDKLDESINAWEELAQLQATDSQAIRNLAKHSLTQRAELLSITDRHAEAIVLCDAMIASNEDDSDPKLLADAIRTKAFALISQERYDEAIPVLDELIFCSEVRPDLRTQMAFALAGKAEALRRLDRQDEALLVLFALIDRYQDEPSVQLLVSQAREMHQEIVEERE